ncbi:hypothetical protein GJ688_07605 [Heliobacillus mobilis]|uniref:Zinc-ribbon domain-containing protein n=1 Tax=Heliobacterium mobile TaxID=28064 RepID=A0A6I3SJ47_HELMO|nr:zinc ribbon domain-containing protein [Heliobacterium mobile]MTV48846.1 hypothetical protein [Heliobacterium mobile]
MSAHYEEKRQFPESPQQAFEQLIQTIETTPLQLVGMNMWWQIEKKNPANGTIEAYAIYKNALKMFNALSDSTTSYRLDAKVMPQGNCSEVNLSIRLLLSFQAMGGGFCHKAVEDLFSALQKGIGQKATRFCQNCGEERREGKFCPNCGTRFE